jgi:alpha-L-arabinofuranosidase
MKKTKTKGCLTSAILAITLAAQAQPAKISVDVAHPGHPISPMLWGIFFEDINLSADGGIYPELVRNRSFEDAERPQFWKFSGNGSVAVASSSPLSELNRHYLEVRSSGSFTLRNDGYWGMNVVQGNNYLFKTALRGTNFSSPLTVRIVAADGTALASGKISVPQQWAYQSLHLAASGTDPKAQLEISGDGNGSFCLDMVSLIPEQTWKNHDLRIDLAESLDALHPAFMRFPGGNWIEGDDIAHMYHWKDTVGDLDSRKPLWNTWGYNTTQGLGFHEYLQLCADLECEPVFGINCGMALNGHSVPMKDMGAWVQDALDAVEYANGPTNSLWGSRRAQAGHPAPFGLKYVEIGNENGGPDYAARWPLLVNAIRARYPEIQCIMTTDLRSRPYPKTPTPDIIDEHYYESPESFMRRANQYDSYDRHGAKIFIGEYAVTQNAGEGNLRAAIGEAAFMTGMERNSDIVKMASYAPLFVNLNHRAWNPDLINFDSSRWYGIPSYYVQKMFSENRGDQTLPLTVESPEAEVPVSKGRIGVGTWNTAAEFKDIKVTSPNGKVVFASDFSKSSDGWKLLGDGAEWSVQDGAIRQSTEREFIRALTGDMSWTDYTLTLKARKISGREGFLVLFHIASDEDRVWWNIGGWNNTQNAVESGSTLDGKPGHIDAGRWYDIRIDVRGNRVKCFLNGNLIHDIDYQQTGPIKALYACASHDDKNGDVILKVVNASAKPLVTSVDLSGAKDLTSSGTAVVLTGDQPGDENTLDEPTKISPKSEPFNFNGSICTRAFPGNSFTVLRFHTAK